MLLNHVIKKYSMQLVSLYIKNGRIFFHQIWFYCKILLVINELEIVN